MEQSVFRPAFVNKLTFIFLFFEILFEKVDFKNWIQHLVLNMLRFKILLCVEVLLLEQINNW